MFRLRLTSLLAVLLIFIVGCTQSNTKKGQVLIILEEKSYDMELMLTKEVGVMKSMLEKEGYKVVTASASGQPLTGTTTTITPDIKLADVNINDYIGFMVPCMAIDLSLPKPPEAIKIVKEAAVQGKPIAAQMNGVLILGEAGVLDGKQFALWSDMSSSVPNGIYKGEGVVQDGNIITSGICPYIARELGKTDGTTELTQKFIDTLAALR
jgi:putative intracellular protease/amidase